MWRKPGRTDKWWDNLVSGKMHEDTWKENFRMSKTDFYELVSLIRPHAKIRSDRVRKDIITLEKRLAITLCYLKDQGSMTTVANLFGIARCTVGQVVSEICKILSQDLGKELIKFPSEKEDVEKSAAQFFHRFGFPQVIGCVDGTHIPIRQPTENPHDYFSYKLCYSLNCQAICDAYGRFVNVEIKWPGSVHDARVFANSSVQKNFSERKFKLFYKQLGVTQDDSVPQLLLGDPAYPLLPYLMKEYESCNTNEEVIFNLMLRGARNQIECAFGRLKARWRILLRPMDIPIEKLPNVIFACFVLHNFCEKKKAEVDQRLVEKIVLEERKGNNVKDMIHSYNSSAGKSVREHLTRYFKDSL